MAPRHRGLTRRIALSAYRAALHDRKRKEHKKMRKKKLLVLLLSTVAAFAATLCIEAPEPIPMHTSILSGHGWLTELINGHPERFRNQMGMAPHVYLRLLFELQAYSGLANSKFVSAAEKLGIFLHFVRTGSSSRMLQERFQRSAETISKYVSKIYFCSYINMQ
jgi:hypothetical protein